MREGLPPKNLVPKGRLRVTQDAIPGFSVLPLLAPKDVLILRSP
jgi:hypothetical protein